MKNQKNKYQKLSVFGLKYIRVITDDISNAEARDLKKKYSYIAVYSYNKPSLKGFSTRTQTISTIDLSQDLDSIFSKFKKNTRNEIRKTEKIDGLVFKNLDKNLKSSYSFYRKIKKEDGTIPDIKTEFTDCIFFNAYLKGKMTVSVSCYDTGEVLRLKHVVSSRKDSGIDSKISGYATRRIIWEICKYGKSNNYKHLDLAGVNLTDETKKGISDFKQSFGGNMVENYISRYDTRTFRFVKKILKLLNLNIN